MLRPDSPIVTTPTDQFTRDARGFRGSNGRPPPPLDSCRPPGVASTQRSMAQSHASYVRGLDAYADGNRPPIPRSAPAERPEVMMRRSKGNDRRRERRLAAVLLLISLNLAAGARAGDEAGGDGRLALTLRSRVEVPETGGQHRVVERAAAWEPKRTAIIVCDMWDLHHCLNATRRGAELAPRMDRVLRAARDRGVLVIHAPSSCMP